MLEKTDAIHPPMPLGTSFRWLVATRAAEGFADALARTLLPIVAVTVLGLGTAYVGVLNSLSLASFLLLGVPIGIMIDRRSSRTRAMAFSSLARVFILILLAALYLTQALNGPVLLAAALILGIADVVFTTAESTVIPAIVPEGRLKEAYSRLAVTGQSTSTAASLIGSIALGLVGVIGMIGTAICSYTASLFCQLRVKTEPASPSPAVRGGATAEGMRILFSSAPLRALTYSAALTNAGVMLGNTVLPVLVLSDLGISPAVFAAMGIVSVAGSILGSAAAPSLHRRFGLRRLRVTAALLAGPAVLLAVFCRDLPGHEIIWLMLQAILWNLLVSISSVAGSDVLPRIVPRERLATVGAAQRTITLGIMPISAIVGGAVGAHAGTAVMMWAWAGLALLSAIPLVKAIELDRF